MMLGLYGRRKCCRFLGATEKLGSAEVRLHEAGLRRHIERQRLNRLKMTADNIYLILSDRYYHTHQQLARLQWRRVGFWRLGH